MKLTKGRENIIADVRRNIKRLRMANGMTQKELAEKIGKSESTIGAYEQGVQEIPLSALADMEAAFGGCGMAAFWEHEERPDEYIGNWDFKIRVFKQEHRRIIAGILSENGYDVGQHKQRRTRTGKTVDYYIHGRDIAKVMGTLDEE